MILRALALLLTLSPILASAQYVQDWQVDQDFYEYGYLYYDFSGDGVEELIKPYGNTVYVFDGSQDYDPVWTISNPAYESVTIWDEVEVEAGTELVVFIAANTTDSQEFTLQAYPPLGTTTAWTLSEQPGSVSYIDVGNLDTDAPLEIVVGINEYQTDDQSYVSRFLVLDGPSGAIDFTSGELNGFMVGPYAGDIDGNGEGDILVNLYDVTAQTSTLHAFSFAGSSVSQREGELTPREIELRPNFPNPFNPATTIPLVLERAAEVAVNVVNVQGQRVKTILSGSLSAGRHEFHWDGRDDSRQRVASGLYFAEVITDGHRIQRPMVLLK